jgi:hypothetical protein
VGAQCGRTSAPPLPAWHKHAVPHPHPSRYSRPSPTKQRAAVRAHSAQGSNWHPPPHCSVQRQVEGTSMHRPRRIKAAVAASAMRALSPPRPRRSPRPRPLRRPTSACRAHAPRPLLQHWEEEVGVHRAPRRPRRHSGA